MEGILDCREAQMDDRKWWLKVAWTLDWLEQRNRNEIHRLDHAVHCALLDYSAERAAFSSHWRQADALREQFMTSLLPWEATGGPQARRQQAQLVQAWTARYGDPSDPEVAAKIEKTVQALRRQAASKMQPLRAERKRP